ncbi:MAG: hypothetical protein ACK4IY_05495 [Chitinophagales bacterium]
MNGQNTKYLDAMKKAIAEFSADSTAEQFTTVANKFERIALAEKIEWLPYYYAALSKTYVSFLSNDKSKVDEILDGAQKLADKADSLSPGNSEVVLLKSMILGGRIMVDPMSRGMQYGMQAGALTNQAIQLNPDNPRAYLMMGQSLFYTPEQFGGGKDKGCAMLQTSREKFEKFIPASEIDPDWGEDMLLQLIAQCNGNK